MANPPSRPIRLRLSGQRLIARAHLPLAQLDFEREIELDGCDVKIRETVTNLTGMDRPLAWTQHVTLGPPFLEAGITSLDLNAPKSMVFPGDFGEAQPYKPGALFDWPLAPNKDGSTTDFERPIHRGVLRRGHLPCGRSRERRSDRFRRFIRLLDVLFGYHWLRADFPWISLWEENRSRKFPPWNGKAVTRGVEFGVSPFAEGRRAMVERGSLLGVPTYRWLGARESATVHYSAFARIVD